MATASASMRVAAFVVAVFAVQAICSPLSANGDEGASCGEAGEERMQTELLQQKHQLDITKVSKYNKYNKVAWLHIPKCGTSFGTTIVHYANTTLPREAALEDKLTQFLEFYPENLWFRERILWTEMGRFGHAEISDETWSRYNGYFCSLFREPASRMYSMWAHTGQFEGYTQTEFSDRFAGQVTRMVTGQQGGRWEDDYDPKLDPPNLQKAIDRMDGFMFVGLTEEYAFSLCLFHAKLGGECLDNEFENLRPSTYTEDTNPFQNYSDPADYAVYNKASKMFWADIADYNVNSYTCMSQICPTISGASLMFGLE